MSDQPDGFGEIEAPFASALMRRGRQVLNEYARDNPEFAAERRQDRRQAKAWRREQGRIAHEVGHLQIPFVVAALNRRSEETDAAAVMLKVSSFLYEHDAPFSLISDLLRVGKRLIPE